MASGTATASSPAHHSSALTTGCWSGHAASAGTAVGLPNSVRVADYEAEVDDDTVAKWMDAAFGHLQSLIESGRFPHLQRAVEANRAAGGKDEDLGRMASSEGRFERGLELLRDGIEAKFAAPVKRRRGR